jgi:uncharacterized membrane protein
MDKYNTLLVARVFAQTKGVDFYETYTPIVKFASIITIFTFEVIYNLEIHQIDVKGDFVDEKLDKGIYMKKPIRYKLLIQELG